MRSHRHILFFVLLAVLAAAVPCFAVDKYVEASVDNSGVLRIRTDDGRTITVPKDGDQEEFDHITISPDGHAVGWLDLYPNCCTSYPIPLKLAVYMNGKLHIFTGSELPIGRWHFTGNNEQVAFEQETTHGNLGVHYELREIASERLVSEYDPPIDSEGRPLQNQKVPQWVADLDAAR